MARKVRVQYPGANCGATGASHYVGEMVDSAEQRVRRLIEKALRKKGWTAEDLRALRKKDAFKARLAAKLRAQTTMTAAWIAE